MKEKSAATAGRENFGIRSLKKKLQFLFLLSALLPILLFGSYNIIVTSGKMEEYFKQQLKSLAKIKQSVQNSHLQTIGRNLKALGENKAIHGYLANYRKKTSVDSQNRKDAFNLIRHYQENFWGWMHHVFLTDQSGKVILSPPHGKASASHLDQDISDSSYFKTALKRPVITDFFGFEERDHYHQLYMLPVIGDSGETLGIMVVEVLISHQQAILQENFELGKTGKIFMTAPDGTKIVHDKQALTEPLLRKGFSEAKAEGLVVRKDINEAGEDIKGLYLYDPQYPWILSIEIEQSEADELVMEQIKSSVASAVAVLVLVLLISGFMLNKMIAPLLRLMAAIREIAGGGKDFTRRISVGSQDEIGKLGYWFNLLLDELQKIIQEIVTQTEYLFKTANELTETSDKVAFHSHSVKEQTISIAAASEQLTANIATIAAATEQASTNITAVSAAVEELSANIKSASTAAEESSVNMGQTFNNVAQISERINDVSGSAESMSSTLTAIADKTKEAIDISNEASNSAEGTLKTMNKLEQMTGKIGQVVKLIDSITSQTNMLALNAAIEAASAGEAGKGFAVVAAEVKDLAQQTAEANNEIAQQVEGIQKQTSEALNYSQLINNVILRVAEINQSIGMDVDQQSHVAVDISKAVESIADNSKDSVKKIEESTHGLGDITHSVSEASLAIRESAKNLAEGAAGIKEIARSHTENAKTAGDVNKNLQGIQQAVGEIDGRAAHTLQRAQGLNKIATELKQFVSLFKIE
ncbi:MAG: HAMP domain-containing protein [Gammaproteobacteria bacterium]|nr:HAMP domain-containing protein [Gammaproteobacteria bacterium]